MNQPTDAREIRAIVLDVDGVLTDGRIVVGEAGQQTRVFHVHDGFAIRWFQQLGGVVILCSGKDSPAVAARARELEIEHVLQGSRDKVADVQAVLDRLDLTLAQTAVVGDDLPDVPLMRAAAIAIAVANATPDAKAAAEHVTQRAGGEGAVREAIEYLWRATGRWDEVRRHYGVLPTDVAAPPRTVA